MGTTIEKVCVVGGRGHRRSSALRLANDAARQCLDAAAVAHGDVDLLLNAGLYRDRNLGEPALAALIQDDLHMNREDPHAGVHGTFSFDVANGTCGVLTSLQIADGFLRARAIHRALVVTSDADPGGRSAIRFPFLPAGAAALCTWDDDTRGIGRFRWLNAPGGEAFGAVVRFEDGHNRLRVEVSDTFASEAAVVAAKVADEVLAEEQLSVSHLDTVVLAPADERFVGGFTEAFGVDPEQVVHAPDARTHTASFLSALASASGADRLAPGSTILFVCAGSGITAGACSYRP